jgi:hypothetical protein
VGAGAGWSRGALGPVWEVGRVGDGARGGVRWRWPLPAAVRPTPASSRPGQVNGRRDRL